MPSAQFVKNVLCSNISEMTSHLEDFVKDPSKDFTRNRKISFENAINFLISMGGKTLNDELLSFFSKGEETLPTKSALCQQRSKIKPEAFEHLFQSFTGSFPLKKFFQNYRLIACDGSDLNIYNNPEEKENYFEPKNGKGNFTQLHLVAFYDLCNHIFTDLEIQPGRLYNECDGFCNLVDRYEDSKKTIFIADRGFPSYNTIAHVQEKGAFFLFRTENLCGARAHFKTGGVPQTEEFDVVKEVELVRSYKKSYTSQPEKYVSLHKKTHFDYIEEEDKESRYSMNYRLVRIQLSSGEYESLITNLPENEFPPSVLKILYEMRWGLETSFRKLKYAIGLLNFHSKQVEYIKQEIYARMILHNFTEFITYDLLPKKEEENKHVYQVNYTQAAHICRDYIRNQVGVTNRSVRRLIKKYVEALRPKRAFKRKKNNSKHVIHFTYRI